MTDHEAEAIPVPTMAGAFIKRPGMYIGLPVRFDRATAFISGYTLAVMSLRAAFAKKLGFGFRLPSVEAEFQEQLRFEGRLRWNEWGLTIAAEAIGWTGEDPPVVANFTEQQHQAAIEALAPLLERIFSLPIATAEDMANDSIYADHVDE